MKPPKTLHDFWPYYVSQHLHPTNRLLHAVGTSLGIVLAAVGLITSTPSVAVLAVAVAYTFAWAGHYFHERNRPATFSYPLMSLRAALRMYRLTLLGQMDTEILLLTKDLNRLRPD